MAVTFHEVWKSAANDKDLHERKGKSYATHAFLVVRAALRPEMLLALMRLWDGDRRAVGMESIANILRDKRVIDALAADRAARRGADEREMRQSLSQFVDEAIRLVDKYSRGGSHYAVRHKLQGLRNKRLAHRQTGATAVTGANAMDEEIESCYQDISELIALSGLLPNAASVYRHYARLFWAGMRGEQTEGHPNYRARPRGTPSS